MTGAAGGSRIISGESLKVKKFKQSNGKIIKNKTFLPSQYSITVLSELIMPYFFFKFQPEQTFQEHYSH